VAEIFNSLTLPFQSHNIQPMIIKLSGPDGDLYRTLYDLCKLWRKKQSQLFKIHAKQRSSWQP